MDHELWQVSIWQTPEATPFTGLVVSQHEINRLAELLDHLADHELLDRWEAVPFVPDETADAAELMLRYLSQPQIDRALALAALEPYGFVEADLK